MNLRLRGQDWTAARAESHATRGADADGLKGGVGGGGDVHARLDAGAQVAQEGFGDPLAGQHGRKAGRVGREHPGGDAAHGFRRRDVLRPGEVGVSRQTYLVGTELGGRGHVHFGSGAERVRVAGQVA